MTIAMADDCHAVRGLRFGIPLGILVLAVGVIAFDAVDDELFLFLSTHFDPPPPCPPNEIYKTCLGDCSDCEQRGSCDVHGCSRKGCDCVLNFVRLVPGGPCEPVHKCPKPECGENEVFRECGPVCEACGRARCRLLQCGHRCYCREAYLRDGEGKCVPEDNCPPEPHCGRDEQKADSGPADEYCLRDEKDETSNSTVTKERCYCKEGHRRNLMGHCKAEDRCEHVRCLNGEEYQSCPRKCDTTCRNYGDATCQEDGQCYPGCFCPDGSYMDDMRRCVTLQHCPPGSNPSAPTLGPTTTPSTTESTTDSDSSTTNESSAEPQTSTTQTATRSSSPVSTTTPVQKTTQATCSTDVDASSTVDEEEEDSTATVDGTSTTEATASTSSEEEEPESAEEEVPSTPTVEPTTTQESQKAEDEEKKLTTQTQEATPPPMEEEEWEEDNE